MSAPPAPPGASDGAAPTSAGGTPDGAWSGVAGGGPAASVSHLGGAAAPPVAEARSSTSDGAEGSDESPQKKRQYPQPKPRQMWTEEEHKAFVDAIQKHGRDWSRVTEIVGSKTVQQVRSHAQKHFKRIQREKTGEYIPPPVRGASSSAEITQPDTAPSGTVAAGIAPQQQEKATPTSSPDQPAKLPTGASEPTAVENFSPTEARPGQEEDREIEALHAQSEVEGAMPISEPPPPPEANAVAGGSQESTGAGARSGRKKGAWTAEEDAALSALVAQHGTAAWGTVAAGIASRIGRQCKDRAPPPTHCPPLLSLPTTRCAVAGWTQHLDPTVSKEPWSAAEDAELLRLQKSHGNKWALIATHLPGRETSVTPPQPPR